MRRYRRPPKARDTFYTLSGLRNIQKIRVNSTAVTTSQDFRKKTVAPQDRFNVGDFPEVDIATGAAVAIRAG